MSENKLIKAKDVDEKMIKDFLFTSETKLTDKQQNMFLQIAIRHNLDPFKREIYAISYGNEFSIVTGYQVYIERAEASGNLDGWSCVNTEHGAKIMIYRKDWQHPFEWEALYKEFDKGQSSWKTMRQFMIKKVCIGQGFRLAFPAELGNMPYLREEMEGATPFNTPKKPPVDKATSKSESKENSAASSSTTNANQSNDDQTSEEKNGETGEAFIKVVKVTKKKVDDTKSQYFIFSAGETMYSTFDSGIAEGADKIKGTDHEALVLFKIAIRGDKTYYNIQEKGFNIQP